MRLLLCASCAISILTFFTSNAKADVTLVKAGTMVAEDASEQMNQHRYDNEARHLDQDSKYIESRILNPNADSNKGGQGDADLQVTMIKINR